MSGRDEQLAVRLLLDAGQTAREQQIEALAAQIAVHIASHIVVQRGDGIPGKIHRRDGQARLHQVLRHLNADKAAANDNGALGLMRLDVAVDALHIGDIAQCEHALAVHAGDGRHNGLRAGGEDQLVIGFGIFALRRADENGLVLRVDGDGLAVDANIHMEARVEALRRLQEQLVLVGNDAADIIGQTAVCKRNLRTALQENDLCRFVEPPQPCRSRRAAGNAADDDTLHFGWPPVLLDLNGYDNNYNGV